MAKDVLATSSVQSDCINASAFDPDELPESARDEALRIGHMLFLGHSCLEFMKRHGIDLVFATWKAHVQHAASDFDMTASDEEWAWAWESLRRSSSAAKRFGKLRAALVRWKTPNERFDCLPSGAEFGVAIKQSELVILRELLSEKTVSPSVMVKTLAPLRLKPGKANRLDCCDVSCVVTITVSLAFTIEKEADLMRVELSEVEIIDKTTVLVKAKSLNQAYTLASRRLEPTRRGHGGRIYDRFVYIDRANNASCLLDDIRSKIENGTWTVPSTHVEPAKDSD